MIQFSRNQLKTLRALIFFSSFIFFLLNITYAQMGEGNLEKSEFLNFKKLYLHTDRESYFQNDTIWFKAYYLNGQTHKFVTGLYSLYVSLIDSDGKIIQKKVLPVRSSIAIGHMEIPEDQNPGNYMLRAYTEFQKEIGEDVFFQKALRIFTVKQVKQMEASNKSSIIDIDFFPEGGFLLEGLTNKVAVKAIGENGKGINLKGSVMNSSGELLASFDTNYKGMDIISFCPNKNEAYNVNIEQYPEFTYVFDDIVEKGIKVEAVGETNEELSFRVVTNSYYYRGRFFYIAIMHRGKVNFQHKFTLVEKEFPIRIYKTALPAGINRVILLDENMRPISERLYFSKQSDINDLTIQVDKANYENRSEVQVRLFDGMSKGENFFSNLSLSVVDVSALSENGPAMNILSWLLIDSELKGSIETPSDYFIDDNIITSEEKLDLLMMTNGWSRYLWNVMPEKESIINYPELEGISIRGTVKSNITRKPVGSGKVLINILQKGYFTEHEVQTDNYGRFLLDNLYFIDSATLYLQARNKKGRLSTEIFLDSIFDPYSKVSIQYLPTNDAGTECPDSLSKKQYYKIVNMNDYLKDSLVILLDVVHIEGNKIVDTNENDRHFRIYGTPSASVKIKNADKGYMGFFDWLQGRFAGVAVSGTDVRIRGGGGGFSTDSGPLYLLDGVPVAVGVVGATSMSVIDKVEVLKGPDAAIYGTRASGGVIIIFTKLGIEDEAYKYYLPGTLSENIMGYYSSREFYSPKYTQSNIDSSKPDNRISLYWNPNITTEDGMANVSFFTCDDVSHYKIFVEGVTNDGRVCLGTADFSVNSKNGESP